ncbi:17335_t:CDS:2, partial [Dentiscutata erythropus]
CKCDIELFQRSNSDYGFCPSPSCHRPNTFTNWCKHCNAKRFRQNFNRWTSDNSAIDKFIRKAQLSAMSPWELLEWIPYSRLEKITYVAKGGFSTIYKAIWIDGYIRQWDFEKDDWLRKQLLIRDWSYIYDEMSPTNGSTIGRMVVLKIQESSSEEAFLNELKYHLQSFKAARKIGSMLFPLLGCYASLIKRCWDVDPLRRPTANEIRNIIGDWLKYFNLKNFNDIEINEFLQADKKLQEYDSMSRQISRSQLHSEAFYTSRLLNFLSLDNLYKYESKIKRNHSLTFLNENSELLMASKEIEFTPM